MSEYTHWQPFILSYIQYIKDTKKKEGESDHVNKLIAFLFGIASHDFADITWHWGIQHNSSYDNDGFLRAMSHNQS